MEQLKTEITVKENLTKEDLEVAVKNGINVKTAQNRFYNLGWEKQRCITEPVGTYTKGSLWSKYKYKATVARSTFYMRVKAGMDPEQAATKEKDPRGSKKKNEKSLNSGFTFREDLI